MDTWTARKRRLELDDYQLADAIDVPSLFVKRSFVERGFSEDRLVYAPYGVDLGTFQPMDLPRDNRFRVIFAGSLTLRKGIGYLKQGFLSADIPNAELWFVGGETDESDRLLKDTNDHICMLGHVPQSQLSQIYAQADVFLLPSIEEGLAMVQTQALACRFPLISTTNTGGEDLLRRSGEEPIQVDEDILQYPAGFVIPIRRPDCIARCLQLLYRDDNLRDKMRLQALTISQRKMDWSHSADELVSQYQMLLQKRQHTN